MSDWSIRSMPVLTGLVRPTLERSGFDGTRVALSDPAAVGADALADVLAGAGAHVVAWETGAVLVVETGMLPDLPRSAIGVVSVTSGTAEAFRSGDASLPVIACHESRCVRLADRQRGRRILQEVARLTNKRIAGSVITVTGYGTTARSVASTARSLGATVLVIGTDPVAALTARFDGHDVTARPSGMVVVVDGCPPPPVDELSEGAMMVIPNSMPPEGGTEDRPGVWSVRSGAVHVVVPLVAHALGEADLVLSVAALALARLVETPPGPGITAVAAEIDTAVARVALGVST